MRKPLYSKKAQVLLTAEEFAVLQQVARRQKKKLGAVLRDAFDRLYVQRHREERIAAACAQLLNIKAPTTDWDAFEKSYVAEKYPTRDA